MIEKAEKYFYLSLGFTASALGVVGVFLPLMPTTCFLIVAVWAFSKSNPELSRKILQHPQFGPPIKNWMENKSINRNEKCTISLSIVIGFSLSLLLLKPGLIINVLLLSGMIMLLFYINTRAENDVEKSYKTSLTRVTDQKVVF